jgi:hypothetical protein
MVDLGKKRNSEMDVVELVSDENMDEVVHYPTLYLSGIEDLETPDVGVEGTATIKFRVVSKHETERKNDDGSVKEMKSVDIDVMGIDFNSGSKSSSDEDEIEKGLSESEDETEDKAENEKED